MRQRKISAALFARVYFRYNILKKTYYRLDIIAGDFLKTINKEKNKQHDYNTACRTERIKSNIRKAAGSARYEILVNFIRCGIKHADYLRYAKSTEKGFIFRQRTDNHIETINW